MTSAKKHVVAVTGAAGHTGKFVVKELVHRGYVPIAIVRDSTVLPENELPKETVVRRCSLDNANSLDAALEGASAVIHCAGPFLETGVAVVQAALRRRIYYLDVSAEQKSVQDVYDQYHNLAYKAGVALLPGMAFYGGFLDLLVTAAMDGWPEADSVDIAIGLDRWHPTKGTRITGQRNTAARVVISGGALTALQTPVQQREWTFTERFGVQTMLEVPFSEVVQIARHLRLGELHTWLSQKAITDVRDPNTPTPQATDDSGRSDQYFVVEVVATKQQDVRRIVAQGQDIYAFTAPLICEAVARFMDKDSRALGAQPPSMYFDSKDFLSSLASHLQAVTLDKNGNVVVNNMD